MAELQDNTYKLMFDKGEDWEFVNGVWKQTQDGELVPPNELLPHYAFWLNESFSDFTAEFRVRFGFPQVAGVRFFFRAQDATRYYTFDIPLCGTVTRAKHLWGLFTKSDGVGYEHYLKLSLIPRTIGLYDHWYSISLKISDNEFRVWGRWRTTSTCL